MGEAACHLSLDEMVALAEALVNSTEIRSHMSDGYGTVGDRSTCCFLS